MASTSMESSISGQCNVTIEVNGRKYQKARLDILQNLCSDVILGHDFQKQHKNVIFSYGRSKEDLIVTSRFPKSAAALEVNHINPHSTSVAHVADVDASTLFKSVTDKVKPIATTSWFFDKDDRAFIQDQISSLLAANLIKRSDSPWRAQVMIARDEFLRHKKRMCTDYSQTVNVFTQLDAYPLPHIDEIINKLSKYRLFSTFNVKNAYHQIPLRETETIFTAFEALGDLYEFVVLPFGVTKGVTAFQRIIDNVITQEGFKDTFPYLDNVTLAGVDQADHDRTIAAFLGMTKRRNITLNASKTVHSVVVIDILGYRISHNSIQPDPERVRPL